MRYVRSPARSRLPAQGHERAALNAYEYDPAKAKALLKEANWNGSATLEIVSYYTEQFHKDLMQAVQAQLAEVGVKATPRFLGVAAWRELVESAKPKYDIANRGQGQAIANWPTDFFLSNGRPAMDSGSYFGLLDPKLDTLISTMQAASPTD